MDGEAGTLKAPELAEFYGADLDEIHLPMIVLPLHTPWQAAAMRQCLLEFYAGLPPARRRTLSSATMMTNA